MDEDYIRSAPEPSTPDEDARAELERLRLESAVCEACGHRQAEPAWCHACGHRTTWPEWAAGWAAAQEPVFAPEEVRELVRALIGFWPYIEARNHMGNPHPDYLKLGQAVQDAFVKVWLEDPQVEVIRVDGGALCPHCTRPYRDHRRGPGDFATFAQGCEGEVLKL